MDLMGWSSINRYKLLGKLIKTKNDLLFVFDLTTPEIFLRKNADGEPGTISRTPTYTDDWKDQFGLPFEEHLNNVQVGIFDNYTVFGINTKEFPDVAEPDEGEDVKDHVDNKPIWNTVWFKYIVVHMFRFQAVSYQDSQANTKVSSKPKNNSFACKS